MGIWEIILLAIALSMDAFAVAVCKGLSFGKIRLKSFCAVGLWFGLFQGLMPVIGFFIGKYFHSFILEYDHWVALVLLVLIGANMIRESFSKDEEYSNTNPLSAGGMFMSALATSIDALAAGLTLAFLNVNIAATSIIIASTTFILSALGAYIGALFGAKYKSKAELAGGIILILLGVKILLEHLGVM